MNSKFTNTQKKLEISSMGILFAWIISSLFMWNTDIINDDRKASLIPMLLFGLMIYGILSFFVTVPDASNIVTFKKYSKENKEQIIKISRDFFCSVKLILILQYFLVSVVASFNEKFKIVFTVFFSTSLLLVVIIYVIAYRRIPK